MRFLKKYLPSHHTLKNHNHLSWLRYWFTNSQLWHFNRNAVAIGVGVGLFAALIPLPIQMLIAALLAILLRGNVAIAVLMTWVTNPFTMVPIAFLIYSVGKWTSGEQSSVGHFQEFNFSWQKLSDFWPHLQAWFILVGKNFFIGLPIVAITLGFCGYLFVHLLWRSYIFIRIYLRRKKYAAK